MLYKDNTINKNKDCNKEEEIVKENINNFNTFINDIIRMVCGGIAFMYFLIFLINTFFEELTTWYELYDKTSMSESKQYIMKCCFDCLNKIHLNYEKILFLLIVMMFVTAAIWSLPAEYIKRQLKVYRQEHFKNKNFDLSALYESPAEILHSINLIPDIERLNRFIVPSFSDSDCENVISHFKDTVKTKNIIIASADGEQTDYIYWKPNDAYAFFGIMNYISKMAVLDAMSEYGFAMVKYEKNIIFFEKDGFNLRIKMSFFNTIVEICRKNHDFSLIAPTVLENKMK